MDEKAPHPPWLIVILTSPLGLAWSGYDIGAGFTAESDLFEQVADTNISAFYDRLYGPDGAFVGVQVGPVAWPTLAKELPELEHVRAVSEDKQLQVFFGAVPTDLTIVYDQGFGGRIYKSYSGTFAFSFDTFFLSDDERDSIAASPATWITAESIEG
jgi:hypothetical protein